MIELLGDDFVKTPSVLLLGNGLNMTFDGTAWKELIHKLGRREDLPAEMSLPYPLQILLATHGSCRKSLIEDQYDLIGIHPRGDFLGLLSRLLNMGFDDILTTNYSYELERALFPEETDPKRILRRVQRMTRRTIDRAEIRNLMHTFNRLEDANGTVNRVWHIHGEARKIASMVVGHYEYASLLAAMKGVSDARRDAYRHLDVRPLDKLSWVDQFILGDVYVLGFGFNPAEFDLWWLLDRKQREKGRHGRVWFYEPREDVAFDEKIELLRTMDVEILDLGMTLSKDPLKRSRQFEDFYPMAMDDIEKRMSE